MRKFTRRERERAAAAVAERQARHDALVRPVLQDVVATGGGLRLAVARLTSLGIPAPRAGAAWSRKAVWRICQRLGILLAAPGGLDAYRWPRCVRCNRQARAYGDLCQRCRESLWQEGVRQRQRRLEADEERDKPLPLGPGSTSLVAAEKPSARYPRKRLKRWRASRNATDKPPG